MLTLAGTLKNIYQRNHMTSLRLNTTVTIVIVTTENHNKYIWDLFIFF